MTAFFVHYHKELELVLFVGVLIVACEFVKWAIDAWEVSRDE